MCAWFYLQHGDDYSVLFEDTSYPDGYSPPLNVAQRYVIACKEEKKKWLLQIIILIWQIKKLIVCWEQWLVKLVIEYNVK